MTNPSPPRDVDAAALLEAILFAAERHRDQRRKDPGGPPYVNHVIEVAHLLASVGGISDLETLQAGLLHDTLEDTETTSEELERRFGARVRDLVEEVSDDKSVAKNERIRLQIEHTPGLSDAARMIKLADKICNVSNVGFSPPEGWSVERRTEYLRWAEAVVAGCRGVSQGLEELFDERLATARARLV